jgi:hypothetical protein
LINRVVLPVLTPAETYRRKHESLSSSWKRLKRLDARFANGRLAVALSALVVAWPALLYDAWSWRWILIPVGLFVLLAGLHARVILRKETCRRAVDFYGRGIDRLEHSWQKGAVDGSMFQDDDHIYASDLDLFGPASLFALLCTARTLPGQQTLADWFKAPTPTNEVNARHEAVKELSRRLDLREDLAVVGKELTPKLHQRDLVEWSQKPVNHLPRILAPLAAALAALNVTALSLWAFTDVDPGWVLVTLGLSAIYSGLTRRRVQLELDLGTKPVNELRLLSEFLHRIENDEFQSSKLRELQTNAPSMQERASRRIAQLARLIDWNESRRNQMFLPVASVLLLGTQLAVRIQRWRRDNREEVNQWLQSLGEFEALCSIATFAFENPDYAYPSLHPTGGCFKAENLGHPLLASASRVGNDIELSEQNSWLLVSGSNMSGKSTLLRSVGINAVLAFAGAPVCANSLTLSQLAIGASIRAHDSLSEGVSRFYAEIQRLTAIRNLAEGQPVLFLLDEILQGTNSHDRRIGAEGVLRDLLAKRAIGLVTTHDLALTEITHQLVPSGSNTHFEDHLDGDRIAFDYTLQPGPVKRGNALALMRSLGLKV